MKTQLDIAGLTEEQIALLQSIINAFQAKNQLEQITTAKQNVDDILDALTANPIEVDGFLSREEIYSRSA